MAKLVNMVGSSPFVVKGTINNAQTTYTFTTTPMCIGGLITVATGLPAWTILTALNIRVTLLNSNFTSGTNFLIGIFDANPTASTYTDNTAVALNSADLAKMVGPGIAAAVTGITLGNAALMAVVGPRTTVDGTGSIYFALAATATMVLANTNILAYKVDGTY